MALAIRWPAQDAFDQPVYAAAAKYGVDPALVKAVIATESGFEPDAYNPNDPGGAWGLMQVIESTARGLGYQGPMSALFTDPALAIDLGTKYLGQQAQRYGGSVADTAAAYNAGSARQVAGAYVNQVYVDRVLERFRYFVAWEAEKGGAGAAGGFPDDRARGGARGGAGATVEDSSRLEAGRGAVDPDAGSPLSTEPSPPFPLPPPLPGAVPGWVRRASEVVTRRRPLWPIAIALAAFWAAVLVGWCA